MVSLTYFLFINFTIKHINLHVKVAVFQYSNLSLYFSQNVIFKAHEIAIQSSAKASDHLVNHSYSYARAESEKDNFHSPNMVAILILRSCDLFNVSAV